MDASKRRARPWIAAAFLGIAVIAAFIVISVSPGSDLPDTTSDESSLDWREALLTKNDEDSNGMNSESLEPSDREAETRQQETEPDLLMDRSAPLNEREKEAFRLAREAPEEAYQKLRQLLDNEVEDPRLRASAAHALGEIDTEAARALGESFAADQNPVVARGAVRGIAARGDPEANNVLESLLYNPDISEAARMEAAHGMAGRGSRNALAPLLRATYSDIDSDSSEPVFRDVLDGLAGMNEQEARDFVNDLIDHPEVESASKIVAIEGLVDAKGDDVVPTLLKHAASEDAEIREAAMWALAGRNDVHRAHEDLANLLKEESAPWVRANLYEALRIQEEVDLTPYWSQVTEETDIPARLAGINLIAGHLTPDQTSRFDSEIVPELRETASGDPSLSNRISAIVALGRAEGSVNAREALQFLQWESGLDTETRRAAELALHREE